MESRGMSFSKLAAFIFLFSTLTALSSAEQKFSHKRVEQNSEDPVNGTSYDYIIIGGGTSGLTVADRLTEDGTKSVLVIEYGYIDNGTDILNPPGSATTPLSRVYNYTCLPQPELNNRTRRPTAGAVLGGSSAVNGMYFDRGSADDYDNWEKLGNPGWGWEGLFPYFQKSVNFTPPSAELQKQFNVTYDVAAYGHTGPVHSSFPPFMWPTQAATMQAFSEYGLLSQREGANGAAVGVFWVPSSMDPDTRSRSYARTAHYDPVAHRKNYHLLAGYRVNKILFSKDLQAQRVEVVARDTSSAVWTMSAKKEIIVAAGAINTPLLLQRSGLGPKTLLKEAGIEVLVDLPGVGQNFQDHPACNNAFTFTKDLVPNRGMLTSNQTFSAAAQREWLENRTGPISSGIGNGGVFIPLRNLTSTYTSIISSALSQNASSYLPAHYTGALLRGFLKQREILTQSWTSPSSAVIEIPLSGGAGSNLVILKPLSRGSIALNTSDPYGNPLVDYNTLINPLDRQLLIEGLALSRGVFNSPSMLALGAVETSPGANVTSEKDIRAWIREKTDSSIAHPCGTASMMPRELGGVVGSDLLVYGVRGLSVVDASVIPLIPGTHLSATVYAVAEKAADLIKARG